MKIAIDIRNIGKGRTGDEVVFFELVRHIAQIDENNDYHLMIDARSRSELDDISFRLGITHKKNFHIAACGTGNKFIWNALTVPRYCRTHSIDIYHTQYIIPFFMPAYTKIVTHIHDVSFRVFGELIKKTDAFFLSLLIPRSIRRSDRIIAISQFTKNEIIKFYGCPQEKIVVIYNDGSLVCADPMNDEMVREKYGLPKKYIMAIGTMQPRKNIPFLLDVFTQIVTERDDVSLVLVGKRDHNFDTIIEQKILHSSTMQQRVIFTGYVDESEKCAIYRMAHVFVFPSLYEGFGVPILEAFQAGTPVVVSDIGPHHEVGGEAVLYCDPHSIDQCKKMLYDALDNDKIRSELADAAREQKVNFSWHKSAQQLIALYTSVVHR
jgi:glycosyltransferase involved in cell wall biosynthesis